MSHLSAYLLRELIDYTYWARNRILFRATHVPAAFYLGSSELDHGSMHKTMLHQLGAESLWLARWQGQPAPKPLTEAQIPDLESLRQRWLQIEADMRAFVDTLSDADADRIVSYESGGVPRGEPLWQQALQLVNHDTHHRSEVALAMTRTGHSPGDLDYLIYVREHGRP